MTINEKKVCRECGETELDKFIYPSGYTMKNICIICNSNNLREQNIGEKNPNFDGGKPKIVLEKTCKYCNETNLDKFIYPSGYTLRTVCVKCYTENLIKNNAGEKNPFWRNGASKPSKKCNHCGTTNLSDFEGINRNLNNSCVECYKKNASISSKGRNLGDKNPMKLEENKKKLSEIFKYTLKDYQEKYSWFTSIEEMREFIDESGQKVIQVKCKKCNKWFGSDDGNIISGRVSSLKNNNDSSHFYCSEECKNSCAIFRSRGTNKNDKLIPGLSTWRNEVLTRQRNETLSCYNHCEKCGTENNLNVHHEKPIKTHPLMALDPDNGIILCRECHIKFGHQDECSTGNLANLVCK